MQILLKVSKLPRLGTSHGGGSAVGGDTGENPHLNRDESLIPVEYQVIFGCLS